MLEHPTAGKDGDGHIPLQQEIWLCASEMENPHTILGYCAIQTFFKIQYTHKLGPLC